MQENEAQNLLKSIRNFLKQEEETYGPFRIPTDVASSAPARIGEPLAEPQTPNDPKTANEPQTLSESQTLDQLKRICINAEELRTDLENTNLVFGTGNPNADVMFIGEAPGSEEDKQGEPFVGRAGQLLNKILAAIDFQRDDVYIANILKHRPPNNRDPLPDERQRSLPYLYRQIDLIQPRWIVCLGRVSVQTLLDTTRPMKELRGKFHPFRNGIELMVTYHPAALLKNPAWKRDTWEDVKMLRERYDEMT